jgi:hypothetical protein
MYIIIYWVKRDGSILPMNFYPELKLLICGVSPKELLLFIVAVTNREKKYFGANIR